MTTQMDLPRGRRQILAQRLQLGRALSSGPLAAEFGVSEDAIRRDLRALAAEGLCTRVYGGALPLSPQSTPLSQRLSEGSAVKSALAETALPLIVAHQTLFIDAGSTPLTLARLLPAGMPLRVITPSVPVAALLMQRPEIELYMLGGRIDPRVGASVDARAIAELRHFRFDLCLLGACAISLDAGLTAFDLDDAELKRHALARSTRGLLMISSDKIDTFAPFAIGPVTEVSDYVLDAAAPAPFRAGLEVRGARVLQAAEGPSAG
jgi:DeoR/GlpR family transcriptional regulator of sugar metabolism